MLSLIAADIFRVALLSLSQEGNILSISLCQQHSEFLQSENM